MKASTSKELERVFEHYPELEICKSEIVRAFQVMNQCHNNGGLIMTCGNGGSAQDAGHIVGELMKGFKLKRPINEEDSLKIKNQFPQFGDYLVNHLQGAIRSVSLVDQAGLSTAFINDISADMVYAQQVYGYGKPGDVLIGISTSGNSKNVVNACMIAKSLGITTIGFTGRYAGKMEGICDILIRVPADETYRVQEYHLPVYHALCAMVEAENWDK